MKNAKGLWEKYPITKAIHTKGADRTKEYTQNKTSTNFLPELLYIKYLTWISDKYILVSCVYLLLFQMWT